MKAWGDFAQFAAHLLTLEAKVALELHHALKQAAVAVEHTAQAEFGHYQPAVGQFEKWVPLAESTRVDRVRQGYSADEPLLRSGALRDSVTHEVSALEAVIGSADEVMLYQELGTEKIPPRAVLGPALVRNRKKIKKLLGHAVASGIAGAQSLPKYDLET